MKTNRTRTPLFFYTVDNPIMVTSRNLQCMPSDDEDELEEDDDEEDEDDDDNLLLSEAIKHPFFSVETDFPKNYKRKSGTSK